MTALSIDTKNFIFRLALVILCCMSSCKQSVKTIYFIPRGYKGWVNIVFTDTAKSLQPFRFNDGYVYMITGDPSNFKIPYDQSLGKWHEADYYYYDKDSITKINGKINFDTTIGSPGDTIGVKQKINAYCFFISDETDFKRDPKNPIFEMYK